MQGSYLQVSASGHQSCAVSLAGRLSCWGGEARSGSLRPPPDVAAGAWAHVSVGEAHACALAPGGEARCWGRNSYGEAEPPAGARFTTLSAGGRLSCGVRADGALACWGNPAGGAAAPPPGAFSTVAVSPAGHACAIDARAALVCWGSGMGAGGARGAPPWRSWNGTFVAVSAGSLVTCAVRADGTLYCLGETDRVWSGGAPARGAFFSEAAAGVAAVCGVSARDAAVACWGERPALAAVPPDLVPLGYLQDAGGVGGAGEEREADEL